jgi:hypothetical protein
MMVGTSQPTGSCQESGKDAYELWAFGATAFVNRYSSDPTLSVAPICSRSASHAIETEAQPEKEQAGRGQLNEFRRNLWQHELECGLADLGKTLGDAANSPKSMAWKH